VAITRMAEEAAVRAAKVSSASAEYDKTSLAYKAQAPLYHAKVWIVGTGAVLLLTIFIFLLLPIKAPPPEAPKPCCIPMATANSSVAK
jgi:cellobiose-specific phosphotransferase system component IIC